MSKTVWLHRPSHRLTPDAIEPSCGVMDIYVSNRHQYRVVVDCGLVPGGHGPDTNIFRDGKKIDLLIGTHIHDDHIGFGPGMMPYMAPHGRVCMTTPSWHMVKRGFDEAIKISGQLGVRPPYRAEQVEAFMARKMVIEKPGVYEVLPGIECYFHPEKHINGSCSCTFKIGRRRIHYSGDRCVHDQPGIRGVVPFPKEWTPDVIAGSDCTYGADPGSDLRGFDDEMRKATLLAADAVARKSNILFFCFSKHRAGALATGLVENGFTEQVYMDGGCRYFSERQVEPAGRWSEIDQPFDLSRVRMVSNDSRPKIIKKNGYIVLSSNGMANGGAATLWREQLLPDPDATVVFTGYVAPGTDGHQILEADAARKRGGPVPVLVFDELTPKYGPEGTKPTFERVRKTLMLRCRVEQVRIGSHASRGEIIDWFERWRPETAVLNHGSRAALSSLESELKSSIPRLVRADTEPSIEIEC